MYVCIVDPELLLYLHWYHLKKYRLHIRVTTQGYQFSYNPNKDLLIVFAKEKLSALPNCVQNILIEKGNSPPERPQEI